MTDRRDSPEIERLVADRERARARGDFATADDLRRRIGDAGFAVADTPEGPRLTKVDDAASGAAAPGQGVPIDLGEPPTADATIHWLEQGWPSDVTRGIESFDRHCRRYGQFPGSPRASGGLVGHQRRGGCG